MTAESEFEYQTGLIEEAYKHGLKAFIAWCKKGWLHPTPKTWGCEEPFPSDDFVKGWNAAIASIDGAL